MTDENPTLLGLLGDGLAPSLIGLCVVSGLAVGFLSAPAKPVEASGPAATADGAQVEDPPAIDEGDPLDPTDEVSGAGPVLGESELRRLIVSGAFTEAEREAKRAGQVGLLEEAHLFAALTDRIQPGALARAKTLEEVRVADQHRVGRIKQEDKDLLQLERYDGSVMDLPASGLDERRTLHGMEARRVLAERLRADRKGLGDVGGLTIHRYAFWAFRANLRRLGAELLKEAICSDEGRVLVDMFGSGDYERLQRARLMVCGSIPPPKPEPAQPAKPQPVRPKPEPVAPSQPRPDAGVVVVDPLAEDPSWVKAEEAYAQGVRHYRGAFGQVGSPGLKNAIERFRAAQDLIDPLIDRYEGEPQQRIERRLVELNTLIYDCAKQGGVR